MMTFIVWNVCVRVCFGNYLPTRLLYWVKFETNYKLKAGNLAINTFFVWEFDF